MSAPFCVELSDRCSSFESNRAKFSSLQFAQIVPIGPSTLLNQSTSSFVDILSERFVELAGQLGGNGTIQDERMFKTSIIVWLQESETPHAHATLARRPSQ